jgi:hypothetical protein
MFLAAFTSRSRTVPHAAQVQTRTASDVGPSLTPHTEQVLLVGAKRSTFSTVRP